MARIVVLVGLVLAYRVGRRRGYRSGVLAGLKIGIMEFLFENQGKSIVLKGETAKAEDE